VSLDAHWPERRRTGTDTKRQEGETGLRQRLKMGGVRSLVRYEVQRRSVGSERGRRFRARQVLDGESAHRARSREGQRRQKMSGADVC
jgi:hypothetical protein